MVVIIPTLTSFDIFTLFCFFVRKFNDFCIMEAKF
jgi:hypothetical protein